MNLDEIKQKAKKFDWKKFLVSRNFLIICTVMLLGAGIVVYSMSSETKTELPAENSAVLGNTVLTDTEVSDEVIADGDFFAYQVINREKTRDEAMEVLKTIADSADAMPDAKEEALNSIGSMVSEMNAEANIEALVIAKGFEDCIAIFNGNACTVIVECDELCADDVAKILEIALEQTGLTAEDIKVIGR